MNYFKQTILMLFVFSSSAAFAQNSGYDKLGMQAMMKGDYKGAVNQLAKADVKTINNTKYYHTFEKVFNTNLGTESPIYYQILQQEQIELHKLGELIKAHSGVILDYNTDAINCTFPDNKFPFE